MNAIAGLCKISKHLDGFSKELRFSVNPECIWSKGFKLQTSSFKGINIKQ